MKRIMRTLVLLLFLPLLIPVAVYAQTTPKDVLIVEVQTTGLNNITDQEFIELYNTTEQAIDISSWQLQYSSASGTSWATKATLNGTLYPKSTLLLASNNYLTEASDISFAAGLKQDGGHIRLISPDPFAPALPIVHDLVGWGLAIKPETAAILAAPSGESLQRKANEQGEYIDKDDNSQDFAINKVPTPQSHNVTPPPLDPPEPVDPVDPLPPDDPITPPDPEPLPPVDTTPLPDSTPPIDDPVVEILPLLPLQISELLPNPAPPLSDSSDEYIELYNPNTEAIDLSGFKLQSGNSYSYSHTFGDQTIPPLGYAVFYVSETGLLLANTSGKARLVNPDGQVVSETTIYEDANDGFAWMLSGSTWQWSTSQSPAAPNTVAMPITEVKTTASSVKSAKIKKSSPAKTTTPKAKAVANPKSSTAKATGTKAAAGTTASTSQPETVMIAPLHPGVIAVVSTIAVGYAAYEYRSDMSNRLYQFRRYREARREARQSA